MLGVFRDMADDRTKAFLAALNASTPSTEVTTVPTFTPNQLAAIAREVATNVREVEDIVKAYGLTPEQYAAHIHKNGYYQQLLQSYAKEWESIKSTNRRLAFQAAAALEEQLPVLAYRMGNAREDLADVTSIAKLFAQLAGASTTPGNAPLEQNQRFAIHIVIGDRTVSLETNSPQKSGEEISPNREISSESGTSIQKSKMESLPKSLVQDTERS
jgi:hypothetical protein